MESLKSYLDYIQTLDIDYLKWVLWVLYPVIISFLLPLVILVCIYISALIVFIYGQRIKIKDAYSQDIWDGARKAIAALWNAQSKIWHGYEVEGLDNIPRTGPALIIYYHGVIPVDFYYVMATCLLERGRLIHAVGDEFLFSIPGWRKMMDVLSITPGTVTSCTQTLQDGHILAIAPGGVREALFGDEEYNTMWGKRLGFAKVALQANVPVVPMFTMNCREAFRTPGWGRVLLRGLYERTRLPIVPIYGLFPVKLKTIFGEPIYPKPNVTPHEFAQIIKENVEILIQRHQKRPGNILRALLERLPVFRR